MMTKRIIEERLMEIINKILTMVPLLIGEEHHQITQNIVIYIHSSFMTK